MTDRSIDPAESDQSTGDESTADTEPRSTEPSSAVDPHADKYNDPRAKITPRGILLGLLVVVMGIVGAAASIYGRRTRLGETTRFWGEETILALQLGERIEMQPELGRDFPPVDLTGTPGLGHLRRRLLDERSFDWDSESRIPVTEHAAKAEEPFSVTLRITDPTADRFDPVEIDLDLVGGWAGHSDQPHSVQVVERKRSGLRHFLETIMNKEQNRYDVRGE